MKSLSMIILILAVSFAMLTAAPAAGAASGGNATAKSNNTPELDNEFVSASVDGEVYVSSTAVQTKPVQVITDQVFRFTVTVKNTGTATWGTSSGQRAPTLFSYPNHDSNFGTYLINAGQGYNIQAGGQLTYGAWLRAPSTPGNHTMKWRAKEFIVSGNNTTDYRTIDWFGEVVSVDFTVTERTEKPPSPPAHVKGVVDQGDFEYAGSFTLPRVPDIPQGDAKSFFQGGIAMRTVGGEKRLLLATGTDEQTVYEVAIPEPKKIVGNDTNGVPVAPFRSVLGAIALPKTAFPRNGTMWYDESAETLYWTNIDWYDNSYSVQGFPVLRSAKLVNGNLVPAADWYVPFGTQIKAFWGGVTPIPEDFADKYTDGRRLALGFGGGYSIVEAASFGPALAAVSVPDVSGGALDLQVIFNHTINDRAVRNGNYLGSRGAPQDPQPTSPWAGTWTTSDNVRSGVFIDLPDKKGYVTFTRMGVGRINYDFGGSGYDSHTENAWYFYDWDTMGKAATGEIAKTKTTPSSITTVEYPYEATSDAQWVTGSYFDTETRLLYLYVLNGNDFQKTSFYDDPIIHAYYVKKDDPDTDGGGDGGGDGGNSGGGGGDDGNGGSGNSGGGDGGSGGGNGTGGNGNPTGPAAGSNGGTGSVSDGGKTAAPKITLKKPTKLKLKAGKKSLTVKFKKPKGAKKQKITGYQIQYRHKTKNGWGKWQTKTYRLSYKSKAGTITKKLKNLKPKTRYKVRVRAYKTIRTGANKGKHNSPWTKPKTKRTG